MKNIIEIANDLIHATQSNQLAWEYMDDAPCLTAFIYGQNYIICKTETDAGVHVVSLNSLNQNGELIGDFNKWDEGEPEYSILYNLYNIALQNQVLKAAC